MVKTLTVVFIIILAIFWRFYQLEEIPPGFYVDEAVQGYNAYSIAQTGKDEYGMRFPVFLRGLGTYGAPLYAHLSAPLVKFWGLSIFTIRFLSAFAGVLVTFFTFLIVLEIWPKNFAKAALASLVVAISPWAIFLSRGVDEPNLGLVLLLIGFYFLLKSLTKTWFITLAVFFLALSTYGYSAERVVATLFLIGFLIIFKNTFLKQPKILFLSFLIFALMLLPQLILLTSPAATIRFSGQSYLEKGNLVREFFSQYTAYFSPRNLFFDPDPDRQRSIPNLSTFYPWMIIPLFWGLLTLVPKRLDKKFQSLLFLIFISPILAALTKDPFSSFRTLPSLWGLAVIVGLGLDDILQKLRLPLVKILLAVFLIVISVYQLYSSYFVLLKYERAKDWDFAYKELAEKTKQFPQRQFIIETGRGSPPHALLVFYTKYDPVKFQEEYGSKIIDQYYQAVEFDRYYKFANIETRPINWEEDIYQDLILVGDQLAVSGKQALEHKLTLLFEIKDLTGEVVLKAYSTNPREKCLSLQKNIPQYCSF